MKLLTSLVAVAAGLGGPVPAPASAPDPLPRHVLVGYLQTSQDIVPSRVRFADVFADWDIVNVAPALPDATGLVGFNPVTETETDLIAAIRARQASGRKVLLSIGGPVQLTTAAARDRFVSSVAAIIDRYGLDGLDIDFEGHSLYFNAGDTDFRNPTTPAIVNLISALRTLTTGSSMLTISPTSTRSLTGDAKFPGMATNWTMTIDCARPKELARFWALALGYETAPPPPGFETVEEWFESLDVPVEEWDDGEYLSDPDGRLPKISFIKVPGPKVAKNRMHIDIQVGGGRETPIEIRWPRVTETVDRLVAAGATVIQRYDIQGELDHITLTDPEGNEFCVL